MTARIRGGEAVLRGAMALDGTVKQGKGIAEHDIASARHTSEQQRHGGVTLCGARASQHVAQQWLSKAQIGNVMLWRSPTKRNEALALDSHSTARAGRRRRRLGGAKINGGKVAQGTALYRRQCTSTATESVSEHLSGIAQQSHGGARLGVAEAERGQAKRSLGKVSQGINKQC